MGFSLIMNVIKIKTQGFLKKAISPDFNNAMY